MGSAMSPSVCYILFYYKLNIPPGYKNGEEKIEIIYDTVKRALQRKMQPYRQMPQRMYLKLFQIKLSRVGMTKGNYPKVFVRPYNHVKIFYTCWKNILAYNPKDCKIESGRAKCSTRQEDVSAVI